MKPITGWSGCIVGIVGVFSSLSTAHAQLPVQPVAIRGDVAPGTDGLTFGLFVSWPYINQQGEVAFEAFLNGAGSADFGVWVGRRNDLQLVAREGQLTPDGSGLHYNTDSGFDLLGLANNREVLYRAYLDLNDPGVTLNTSGTVWYGAPGDVGLVDRTETHIQELPYHLFTPQGKLASLGGNDYGVPGNIHPVLPPDSPAPGVGDDLFRSISAYALNDHGQMSVLAYISDPESPCFCGPGIWRIDPSGPVQVEKVAIGPYLGDEGGTAGDPAPGTPYSFATVGFNTINNQGRIAFLGELGSPNSEQGIWTWDGGQPQLLVLEGDAAPIPGQSLTIKNFTADVGYQLGPQLNGRNEVLFLAQLEGPGVDATNDRAMFIGDSAASLRPIAREGDQAPGLPAGVVFDRFSAFDFGPYNEPTMNARGQVAFHALLTGPGIDDTNNNSLWVANPDGRLVMVVREGGQLELEPGLFGTVLGYSMAPAIGGQDGRGIALNDRGQLVFGVGLNIGGSGAFDWAVVIATVPEPAPAALGFMAAIFQVFYRSSREKSGKTS